VEAGFDGALYAGVPAAELKALFVGVAEKAVLYVGDNRADTCLAEANNSNIFRFTTPYVPTFYEVEQEEIGTIVEVVIEAVFRVEDDRCIYIFTIHSAFNLNLLWLVYKELSMVKIEFYAIALFFVEYVPDAVVVLRDGDFLVEDALVPSLVVAAINVSKGIVVVELVLFYMYIALGVSLGIVAPREVECM